MKISIKAWVTIIFVMIIIILIITNSGCTKTITQSTTVGKGKHKKTIITTKKRHFL